MTYDVDAAQHNNRNTRPRRSPRDPTIVCRSRNLRTSWQRTTRQQKARRARVLLPKRAYSTPCAPIHTKHYGAGRTTPMFRPSAGVGSGIALYHGFRKAWTMSVPLWSALRWVRKHCVWQGSIVVIMSCQWSPHRPSHRQCQ